MQIITVRWDSPKDLWLALHETDLCLTLQSYPNFFLLVVHKYPSFLNALQSGNTILVTPSLTNELF